MKRTSFMICVLIVLVLSVLALTPITADDQPLLQRPSSNAATRVDNTTNKFRDRDIQGSPKRIIQGRPRDIKGTNTRIIEGRPRDVIGTTNVIPKPVSQPIVAPP